MKYKLGFALAAIVTIAAAPVASAHNTGYNHTHQKSNVLITGDRAISRRL